MRRSPRATWAALPAWFTARAPTFNFKSTVGITPSQEAHPKSHSLLRFLRRGHPAKPHRGGRNRGIPAVLCRRGHGRRLRSERAISGERRFRPGGRGGSADHQLNGNRAKRNHYILTSQRGPYIVLILMYRRMSWRLMSNPATKVASAKPPNSFHLFIKPSRPDRARG